MFTVSILTSSGAGMGGGGVCCNGVCCASAAPLAIRAATREVPRDLFINRSSSVWRSAAGLVAQQSPEFFHVMLFGGGRTQRHAHCPATFDECRREIRLAGIVD